MNLTFKEEIPFEQRRAEAASIRIKYPERVPCFADNLDTAARCFSVAAPRLWNSLPLNCQIAPSVNTFKVIIEKLPGAQVNNLDKRKFLIPSDISISQLVWIIRKRVHLESEKALFLFVGKTIPSSSASVGEVYEEHRDEDGFLYVQFSGENTFGAHR